MLTERDKLLASATYEFADDKLVEGTKPQEKRNYFSGMWKEDKQKAFDMYADTRKQHVPSMTQEELDRSPMPDWDKEPCDHYWDNQDMCHRCGVPKYD